MNPSPTAVNGRGPGGRFAPGNRAARGNPHARQVARLRSTLLKAVTPQQLKSVVQALIREAEAGNVPAIKELFERTLGKPVELDLIERLERLEAMLAASEARNSGGLP